MTLLFLLISSSFLKASVVYVNALDNTCGGNNPCFLDIQSAIDAASSGDTVFIQNGMYAPSGFSAITIEKTIALVGESESGVVIDASSLSSFGLYVQAENVLIKSLRVQNAPLFGIVNIEGKAAGLSIENVTSNNNGGSGIGLRDVVGVTLKNLTLENNAGNGLSMTSVHNVTVENISTSGNQFSNIEGFTAAIGIFSSEDSTTSNVTFSGEYLFTEPVGLYVEPGPLSQNYLVDPPLLIDDITISDTLKAVLGIDVDIVPNKAQTDVMFDTIAGADAIYYFRDLETAVENAKKAARLNPSPAPNNAVPATDGLLEQYLFIYDIENDEVFYLPIIDESPENVQYGCIGGVSFSVVVDPRSTDPTGFWEVSVDNGSTWDSLINNNMYSNTDSNTLSIDSVSLDLDGNIYRYISQNIYGADTSAGALLTVPEGCFLCQKKPTLNCPADVTVDCDIDSFEYVIDPGAIGMASATSNCQDVPIDTIYYVDNDQRTLPCLTGHIIRTWYASDAAGNIDSCTQTITVIDTLRPVLSVMGGLPMPSDTVYYECGPIIPHPPQVVVEDNCSMIDTIVYQADTFDSKCEGNFTIRRTWSATDGCDNTVTHVQFIRVLCDLEIEICELADWTSEPNPFNHSIYLFQSPLDPHRDTGIDTEAQRFVWDYSDPDHKPQFMKLPGKDTAIVTGLVKSRLDDDAKFEVMLIFVNPESGLGYTGEFVADNPIALEVAEDNVDDWTLWKLSDESKLIGKGNIQGTLHLSHAPADFSKRAQEGVGGNAKDGDLGLASWFLYEGDLIYDGTNVSLKSQGDINADIVSCDTLCGVALPTVVNQLDGNLLASDNLIQLSWGTYMEGPNEIVVEKSVDGIFFTPVDTLQGDQNSISHGSDEYFDEDVAGSDVLYYRLRVTRPDGSAIYTNVVAIYVGDPDKHYYLVYPNPVDEYVYVRAINPEVGNHKYRIFDSIGRTIKGGKLDVSQVYRIGLNELNAGNYFFQIIKPNGEIIVTRLSVRP